MSYCPKCGSKLDEGMSFCPKCGAPVNVAQGPTAPGAPTAQTRREYRRREKDEEKGEKHEKEEKGEKGEKGEGGFLAPLVGGLILVFLGVVWWLGMNGMFEWRILWALFIVLVGIVIIIAAVYGALVLRKRHPIP
jgi:zinc-ribbon domain